MNLSEIKTATLALDQMQQRPWQVWANNQRILQENGSNPKLRQLGNQEVALIAGFEENCQLYECRIIKYDAIAPLIRADVQWQISIDGGVTKKLCRVMPPIKESTIQNMAWLVILRVG